MSAAAEVTPFPGYSMGRMDDEIVHPDLYASEKVHDVYARLRREDPVHWTEPRGFRPFWSVTTRRLRTLRGSCLVRDIKSVVRGCR